MTAYRWFLWGWGANAVGRPFARDRERCTNCGKWAKRPAWYELDRVLCETCHETRGLVARAWLESHEG